MPLTVRGNLVNRSAVFAVAGESFDDGGADDDARRRREHLHALRVSFLTINEFRDALTSRAARPVNLDIVIVMRAARGARYSAQCRAQRSGKTRARLLG